VGDAIACYRKAVALRPDLAEAHANLATALFEQRELAGAMACFERAVALKPDLAEAWLGLGHVLHQAKRFDDALAAFGKAPELAQAWLGRARTLRRLKRLPEAVVAYRQALAKGGDAEAIQYYLAALGAEKAPVAAPGQLVSSLFDRYSDRYDQHVVGALKYRTPDLLFDALAQSVPAADLDILDLGCGTGLSGARLKARARSLTGVDISSNMLAVARQRQIYDNLVHGEMSTFLQGQIGKFDLVVAADTAEIWPRCFIRSTARCATKGFSASRSRRATGRISC
jgi:predicted TPR repeat methyltransferase